MGIVESRIQELTPGFFAECLAISLQEIKPDPNYPVLNFALMPRIPLEMFGLTVPDLYRLVLITVPLALKFGTRKPMDSEFRFPEGRAEELSAVVKEFHWAVTGATTGDSDVLLLSMGEFAQRVLNEFDHNRKVRANHERIAKAGGR